jgi:tetracycline 7-halogenase / FADH2 O2-dependent halogenase
VKIEADIAIVGAGFGGSLLAMALRQSGRSVVLLERARHPRFAIGESSTPFANLLLEQLADRYGLDRVRPLSQWGTWQATHPHLGCGLKRGFSFVWHTPPRQLLVAASPSDRVADTHWYRPDVDAFLVDEARRLGVQYLDRVVLESASFTPSAAHLRGPALEVQASFVVDATGPRGVLHRMLGLSDPLLQWLPATQALYAHFTGVARWADDAASSARSPFPPDDAALHHVIPGGWMWVLRFNNGVTSAGVALREDAAACFCLSDGEAAWHRVLNQVPEIARQFAHARAVTPFIHAPRIGFRAPVVHGPRWALLSSAAGVIDPLLSTGFPLTLLGVQRLARLLGATPPADLESGLAEYARRTTDELEVTERLVAALYATFDQPDRFRRLALLYFAAASYTETVHRLGQPERADGFLLANEATFRRALETATGLVLSGPPDGRLDSLADVVDAAIAPVDVGGWRRRDRRDRYPVDFDDVRAAQPLLGVSMREIEAMIRVSS